MVLPFLVSSGIICMASQCSIILPLPSNLKKSIVTYCSFPGQICLVCRAYHIILCNRPYEVDTLFWISHLHIIKVLNEGMLTITDKRVMLNIFFTNILQNRGFCLPRKRHTIKPNRIALICFKILSHSFSPVSLLPTSRSSIINKGVNSPLKNIMIYKLRL